MPRAAEAAHRHSQLIGDPQHSSAVSSLISSLLCFTLLCHLTELWGCQITPPVIKPLLFVSLLLSPLSDIVISLGKVWLLLRWSSRFLPYCCSFFLYDITNLWIMELLLIWSCIYIWRIHYQVGKPFYTSLSSLCYSVFKISSSMRGSLTKIQGIITINTWSSVLSRVTKLWYPSKMTFDTCWMHANVHRFRWKQYRVDVCFLSGRGLRLGYCRGVEQQASIGGLHLDRTEHMHTYREWKTLCAKSWSRDCRKLSLIEHIFRRWTSWFLAGLWWASASNCEP